MDSARVQLPSDFYECTKEDMAILIADMLERLMAHNDRIPLSPESLTRFHSRSVPNISVLDYLNRIIRWLNVEKSCLLITLHYIDQICTRMPLFTLSTLTCHRFIIASIAVASKGLCDAFCQNSLYARVGGIKVGELNVLEREFLAMIDWKLMCTREILQDYYVNLVRTHSAGKYFLASTATDTTSPDSSDLSRSPSPDSHTHRSASIPYEAPSTILIGADVDAVGEGRRRLPTIEQNMAFKALRDSMRAESERSGASERSEVSVPPEERPLNSEKPP